jgi:hypothetical protein
VNGAALSSSFTALVIVLVIVLSFWNNTDRYR